MSEKLTMAIIGCGSFAWNFVNLFKSHPNTEKIYVCDLIPERAEKFRKDFDVEIIDSFETALANPKINCIGNFTRRHQHGDIVIPALKHEKHVFSAVPMASSVEECVEIAKLAKENNLIYMIGETCYYYPSAMFCREAYRAGKFGKFQYADSQYYHNINTISYGKIKDERGMPPLLYPTHSTAMILSAVDATVKRVTCVGTGIDGDPAFTKEGNPWGNTHINQYVFMELSNGGLARVAETRSFGFGKPSSFISCLYGTDGAYEYSNAQHLLYEKDKNCEQEKIYVTDVSDYVNPKEMVKSKHLPNFKEMVANGTWEWEFTCAVQDKEYERIPKEFAGLYNGHIGSHQLLVDDFCKAVGSGKQPILDAKFAARTNMPGLIAIESAKRGGIPMDVPDIDDLI